MYLLNTSTRRLQEFGGPEQVQYAILSHRWTEEEVTFEDIKDLSSCSKSGASKVTSFCQVALDLGYDWCWIDTCCINRSSSAELSEAINSMFNWYQNSGMCIIYLRDVVNAEVDSSAFESEFRASTWFLRSWTLQELLATAQQETFYYNTNWQRLGTGKSLSALVSNITTIDEAALLGQKALSEYCIAERMSWASMRSATRVEDVAYSLLGIFDIQMPLVYGEGLKAFRRLQQAIMQTSTDETIFAWEPSTSQETSLLARSPALFAASRFFQQANPHSCGRNAYELMGRGVRFDSARYFRADTHVNVLMLNVVQQRPNQSKHQIGIYVRSNRDQNGYDRVWVPLKDQLCQGMADVKEGVNGSDAESYKIGKSFYIPFDQSVSIVHQFEPIRHSESQQPERLPTYSKRAVPSKIGSGYDLSIVPPAMLQPAQKVTRRGTEFSVNSEDGGPVCNIVFKPAFHGVSTIHLGIDGKLGKPVCAILSDIEDGPQANILLKKLGSSIRELTIDYSTVQPIEREILPDRINDGKDWYIQVWPVAPSDEAAWYHEKLWQHPKLQPDLNYFCPFPFDPKTEQSHQKRPTTNHVGWGVELLNTGDGKWKFGLAKYTIVSNWSSKLNKSLVSRILSSRPRSLVDCAYSIDLDTFKSAKRFPMVDLL